MLAARRRQPADVECVAQQLAMTVLFHLVFFLLLEGVSTRELVIGNLVAVLLAAMASSWR